MAGLQDEELRRLAEENAQIAADSGQGVDPGALATHLAGTQSDMMGASLTQRYAQVGARWLADAVPTRLDPQLIDRLSRAGFRRESLADVRIHRGTKAQAAADALGARAFAVGDQDIFFGAGEFDPSTRAGRAVIAHEIAHVSPPSGMSGGGAASGNAGFGAGAGFGGAGGIPSSFGGAPVLNESKRGDEDAAGEEAHESQAREAEGRVFAQDDDAGAPAMADAPTAASGGSDAAAAGHDKPMDPQVLEAKVISLLMKFERSEIERSGAF